jgi:hypothetical protein
MGVSVCGFIAPPGGFIVALLTFVNMWERPAHLSVQQVSPRSFSHMLLIVCRLIVVKRVKLTESGRSAVQKTGAAYFRGKSS